MASTTGPQDIHRLAELIAARNEWERETAAIIAQTAQLSHLGEYIAAHIFDIWLETHTSRKASDGVFAAGPLAGRPVNINWYARLDGLLDLAPGYPDFYLVMAGPAGVRAEHSHPWLIDSVFLFDSAWLIGQMWTAQLDATARVPQLLWNEAELYPQSRSPHLTLTDAQRDTLRLFGSGGDKSDGNH